MYKIIIAIVPVLEVSSLELTHWIKPVKPNKALSLSAEILVEIVSL